MSNELITLIANLALTLSFLVALVFGIAQVRSSNRDRRERLTLETLRNFQTHEFAGQMFYITSHDLPATYEEMKDLPEKDQVILIQFSQEMESLGIQVAERLINIDLVDKTLGSLVTNAWGIYKKVFLDIREKQSDPFLGEYFQWLAEQIEARMRQNPRKPFFQTSASSSRRNTN